MVIISIFLKTKESILGSVFIIVGLLITLVLIQIKGKLFRNSNYIYIQARKNSKSILY